MELKHTIVLLINPLANKKRIGKIVSQVSAVLSSRNILFTSFTDSWPNEINSYKEVWLIGGDGTLNYFINFYNRIDIPIVVFKGGTGNDFATKLYDNISVSEQIEKILESEIKFVDAAECNGRRFVNGVGIGFDGEVLKSINSIRLLGGHLGYLWVVIRKIFSFREKDYKINFDKNALSRKFLLVMITNSTTTGGGFIVSPKAKINDGKLNMVLCKPQPVMKRLQYLPIIEKGKHIDKDFIIHKEVTNVQVECENETLAQIDGELFSARTFDIKVLPKQYMFKY